MNNNFCYHPWVGLDIENNGEIKPCCKFRPELENWVTPFIHNGVESYLASEQLDRLKKQFLNNEKPAGCVRCWKDEEAKYPSKRQLDAERWKKELDTYNLNSNQFLFLTIPLGNFCNLKCRICGPESSTTWIKEFKDLYGKKVGIQDWHKDSLLWNDLINFSQQALEIHLHGGEPFLYDNTEHLELLDRLVSSGHSNHVRLHYSTNGTVFPNETFWNYWKNFGWVDLQLSIDDMGKRFEYNRHPAKWKTVEENLFNYRDRVAAESNLQLSISTTVSVFTVYYLEDFFDYMHNNNIPTPWLGRLNQPSYYRASVLPEPIRSYAVEKLKSSKHADLQKIALWFDDDDSSLWPEFLAITKNHDAYRLENFTDTFPEITQNLPNK